jgi:hypothetical protein
MYVGMGLSFSLFCGGGTLWGGVSQRKWEALPRATYLSDKYSASRELIILIEVEGIGGLSPPFLVLSEQPVGLYPDENPFS